jgi:hypothetical protein
MSKNISSTLGIQILPSELIEIHSKIHKTTSTMCLLTPAHRVPWGGSFHQHLKRNAYACQQATLDTNTHKHIFIIHARINVYPHGNLLNPNAKR